MLIIATATSPDGRVTRHLVRAKTGSAAYRRLRPLLTPGSHIDTCSLTWWRATRDELPRDLRPLDPLTADERRDLKAAGGRLIDPATPALPAP